MLPHNCRSSTCCLRRNLSFPVRLSVNGSVDVGLVSAVLPAGEGEREKHCATQALTLSLSLTRCHVFLPHSIGIFQENSFREILFTRGSVQIA